MRDKKPLRKLFIPKHYDGESSHYLDRRYLPTILGWCGVAILLFYLPLLFSSASIDAMDHLTKVQLEALHRHRPYPPVDDHAPIDAILASASYVSYCFSASALVMAIKDFMKALKPRY
jgi:hypothetical protein